MRSGSNHRGGNTPAGVIIYRSSGAAWKIRTAQMEVDGAPAGRLRSGARLHLHLTGRHTIRAHIGNTWTPPTTVDINPSRHEPAILALRATLPVRGPIEANAGPLHLVPTSDFGDRGMTWRDIRRNRPPVGYRKRGPREQLLWIIALVLLFGGQIIAHTVNRAAGLSLGLVGAAIVVVLFLRVMLYRQSGKDDSRPGS